MHSELTVSAALKLRAEGLSVSEVARQLGLPRGTVHDWLSGATPHIRRSEESYRCREQHRLRELPPTYPYLLGLYLGDGCISAHHRGVHRLRIVLDLKYPAIIEAARAAMEEIRAGTVLVQRRRDNCVEVSSYWQHWPCLFPQHGPGKKHERPIVLSDWQAYLTEKWPQQLLRGLVDSDGCRFQNTGRQWSWPRYSFANHSEDIRRIFCRACDQVGVRWTLSAPHTVYVSRKADVAILDRFIGPKR